MERPMTIVDEARAALLHLLGDATSSTAVEDLEAAIRAESAETLADLERRLADCIVQGAGPAFDAVRAERESAETLRALREAVRPELVQWFHDGVEQCEHDYEPPPCVIDADAMLRAFDVSPRLYEKDGLFSFESHHFERLHRAALAATPAEDES